MMAREIWNNNRFAPFSFGLYNFLGIVAVRNSLIIELSNKTHSNQKIQSEVLPKICIQ